ncbi:MAG: hypothetical protein Q8O95_03265 [bacterium]|nr:hypothetical protein [bacterium]
MKRFSCNRTVRSSEFGEGRWAPKRLIFQNSEGDFEATATATPPVPEAAPEPTPASQEAAREEGQKKFEKQSKDLDWGELLYENKELIGAALLGIIGLWKKGFWGGAAGVAAGYFGIKYAGEAGWLDSLKPGPSSAPPPQAPPATERPVGEPTVEASSAMPNFMNFSDVAVDNNKLTVTVNGKKLDVTVGENELTVPDGFDVETKAYLESALRIVAAVPDTNTKAEFLSNILTLQQAENTQVVPVDVVTIMKEKGEEWLTQEKAKEPNEYGEKTLSAVFIENPGAVLQRLKDFTLPPVAEVPAEEARETTRENAESIREQAVETLEKVKSIETEKSPFSEANLENPEGTYLELQKLQYQENKLGENMTHLQIMVMKFDERFQKFEEDKGGWGVFLRGGLFGDDPESVELMTYLKGIRVVMAKKEVEMKARREKLEAYAQKIQEAAQKQKEQIPIEKDKALKEAESQEKENEEALQANREKYALYEGQENTLREQQSSLFVYREGLSRELSGATAMRAEAKVKAKDLQNFDQSLESVLSVIADTLLQEDLTNDQRVELERNRDEIMKHKGNAEVGLRQIVVMDTITETTAEELGKKVLEADHSDMSIDDYLSSTLDPSLSSISASIELLEAQKMQFAPLKEQINFHYDRQQEGMEVFELTINDNIKYSLERNEQLFTVFNEQKHHLDHLEIKQPNLWDATGGLFLGKVGEGLTNISGLGTYVSDWMKETTKDIPVIGTATELVAGVTLDIPAGIVDGAGELVTGVNMMISHPLDTLNGMGSLIGRNPQTGEWSFETAGHSWKEMGKALIAYKDFSEGDVGKGIGKVALNVFLTLTGAGAAAKGAKEGAIAFNMARTGGAGLAKATLKASWRGGKVFAGEIGSSLKSLPKGVGKFAKNVIGSPLRVSKWLLNKGVGIVKGKGFRLQQAILNMSDDLARASAKLDDITIGGKKVSEIKGLVGKSFKDIQNLSEAELAALGLNDAKAMQAFSKYKEALKGVEGLGARLESARALAEWDRPIRGGEKIDWEAFQKLRNEGKLTPGKKYNVYHKARYNAPDEFIMSFEGPEIPVKTSKARPGAGPDDMSQAKGSGFMDFDESPPPPKTPNKPPKAMP